MPDTPGWRRTGTHGNNVSFEYGVSPAMPDTPTGYRWRHEDCDPTACVATDEQGCETTQLLAHIDALTAAVRAIYDDSRNYAGVCNWCAAPPPDDTHDHDVACPAAKIGYILDLPGYHDWMAVADRLTGEPHDA